MSILTGIAINAEADITNYNATRESLKMTFA